MVTRLIVLVISYIVGIAGIWSAASTAVKLQYLAKMMSVREILLWALLAPVAVLLYIMQHPAKESPTEISPEKRIAMYPPIPAEYLSKEPDGVIVARWKKFYVRIPLTMKNIMHGLILGSPGSSKSSGPLISTLLAIFHGNILRQKSKSGKDREKPVTCMVLDVKPELARKSTVIKHQKKNRVRIVDITDRSSWGWDPYYELDENSSEDEIWRVMDGISRSLIVSANEKDAFFVNSARTILQGMLIYYYRRGLGFIDSVGLINMKDPQEHIKEILGDVQNCPKDSRPYALLNKYANKESEAIQDISMTLGEHISIFSESDVIWTMRDNPRKTCPADINKCFSIFISIKEAQIEHYSDFIRLVFDQFFNEMQKREEKAKNGVVLCIIDELARIGKIDKLTQALSTGRSRGLSCWLATQDMSQLEAIYGKEGARTIQNLSEVTVLLSCKDIPTAQNLCAQAGHFTQTKRSIKSTGQYKGDETVSYETKDIVEPSDLMTLRKTGEVVLFIEGKYYRTKRIRYFEDPVLKKWADEVKRKNEEN